MRSHDPQPLDNEAERLYLSGMEKLDTTMTTTFNRALAVFGDDPTAARTWMHEPLIALGGRTPLEFMGTEEGAREVEELLGRIEHGDFS